MQANEFLLFFVLLLQKDSSVSFLCSTVLGEIVSFVYIFVVVSLGSQIGVCIYIFFRFFFTFLSLFLNTLLTSRGWNDSIPVHFVIFIYHLLIIYTLYNRLPHKL